MDQQNQNQEMIQTTYKQVIDECSKTKRFDLDKLHAFASDEEEEICNYFHNKTKRLTAFLKCLYESKIDPKYINKFNEDVGCQFRIRDIQPAIRKLAWTRDTQCYWLLKCGFIDFNNEEPDNVQGFAEYLLQNKCYKAYLQMTVYVSWSGVRWLKKIKKPQDEALLKCLVANTTWEDGDESDEFIKRLIKQYMKNKCPKTALYLTEALGSHFVDK